MIYHREDRLLFKIHNSTMDQTNSNQNFPSYFKIIENFFHLYLRRLKQIVFSWSSVFFFPFTFFLYLARLFLESLASGGPQRCGVRLTGPQMCRSGSDSGWQVVADGLLVWRRSELDPLSRGGDTKREDKQVGFGEIQVRGSGGHGGDSTVS